MDEMSKLNLLIFILFLSIIPQVVIIIGVDNGFIQSIAVVSLVFNSGAVGALLRERMALAGSPCA